ncbi:MAG: NAD(P)H-dependent oxidoreductase [Gammaproteobacteria bacterium]|nr:NAD(P)H-dependent oxidoreductase [Gammaproteobacteria bacterium]
MHALIVLAHPEPQSFNATLKDVAVETLERGGHTVEVSDLYAQGFDPVEGPRHYSNRADPDSFSPLGEQRHAWQSETVPADVRREIERLQRAELVVLQFPLWWHAQPAILKGWFDRVFLSGGLYTSRMRYDSGYFRGKRAIVSVTSGAPAAAFGPGSRGGDIETMLWPIQYSLHYMGFTVLPAFFAHGVQGHGFSYQDDTAFTDHLDALKRDWAYRLENLERAAPVAFPGWDDWDVDGRLIPGAPVRCAAAGA